jgi:hypothetical protein
MGTTDIAVLHDCVLINYRVDCDDRRIVLVAERRGSKTAFRTRVTFTGVQAYRFDDDAFGNIILDLEPISAEALWHEERDYLQASHARSGAAPWAVSDAVALEHLRREGLRGFRLSASIGLSGWVLAREMTVTGEPQTATDR